MFAIFMLSVVLGHAAPAQADEASRDREAPIANLETDTETRAVEKAGVAALGPSNRTGYEIPQGHEGVVGFAEGPDPAPHDVRLFYNAHRDLFRTVVKGVAISDLVDLGDDVEEETFRIDLRPSRGDQRGRNRGGLFRFKFRF